MCIRFYLSCLLRGVQYVSCLGNIDRMSSVMHCSWYWIHIAWVVVAYFAINFLLQFVLYLYIA